MEKPVVRKTEYKPHTYYDYSLLFITLILVCIGLVMVYSTSSYYAVKQKFGNAAYFFNRQLIAAILGVVVMVIVSKIDYFTYIKGIGKKFKIRLLFLAYMLCIGLQIYVLFFGEEVKGAKRWIKIPFVGTFQPSELTKICVILLVAYIVYAAPKQLDNVFGFIRVIIYVCPLLALVAAENLSTAIIIAGITFLVCFVVARKKGYFFVMGLLAVGLVACYIFMGEAFRGERIDAWLNVETHPKGYQILQGLYAIASGGLWGKGLGQSMQKLGFIPESHNDMIFSVICEELGIVGALAIILLYVLLLWRLFVVAVNARDLFGSLICVGIMVHIAMQVLINIAVVTNTIPSTGIPLPFISYGGTSLVVLMAEMGIALSVSNRIEYER
ncbi:MAG: cell division protein FtsW [Lachnospiraceae bacterium]|nr:cell division protein FtsW [Lachnospiraceae bacterium]